jgi:HK97 gp10 family phage protein
MLEESSKDFPSLLSGARAMIEFEIKGLKELDAELKNFPVELQRKALGTMVAAGGRFIKEEAIKNFKQAAKTINTDKDSKLLSLNNIVLRRLKVRDKSGETLTYGVRAQYPSYFLETGTAPHIIEVVKAKGLGAEGKFGKRVQHPGYAPRPFLTPAIYNNVQRVVNVMAYKLIQWMDREYKRGVK